MNMRFENIIEMGDETDPQTKNSNVYFISSEFFIRKSNWSSYWRERGCQRNNKNLNISPENNNILKVWILE
jgi:hypothetical protein